MNYKYESSLNCNLPCDISSYRVQELKCKYNMNMKVVLTIIYLEISAQGIFDFEIRNKQMFTEAHAFSRVTYFFLFSGEPAGFFLKLT